MAVDSEYLAMVAQVHEDYPAPDGCAGCPPRESAAAYVARIRMQAADFGHSPAPLPRADSLDERGVMPATNAILVLRLWHEVCRGVVVTGDVDQPLGCTAALRGDGRPDLTAAQE